MPRRSRARAASGRAEAVDRTPHDMPNTCDVCGEVRCARRLDSSEGSRASRLSCVAPRASQYCLRGRWSCARCAGGEEYDVCVACYNTASALATALWPHQHGRALFTLRDTTPEEAEEDEEADSAARAAAEADGFFAAGGSPRALASAFAAQRRASPGGAAAGGDDCVMAISAAVDAMQASDERP